MSEKTEYANKLGSEKTWNLTDTLNTNLNSGSLFDGLPENGKKLEALVEGSNGSKFATDTNLRADIGQSKVLDSPAESKSPAIFDGLPESPEKPLASARINGSEATPTAPSLGDTFVKVRGILQKMDAHRKANDYGKPIERGINRAQYETAASALMQKFGDDIENAYGIPSGDVPQLFADVSKSNAGFRSKEDIDRIHSIVKNGVPDFVDTKGNTVALPKNMSFAQAIEVDNQMFTSSLKGKEPVDLVKRTGEIQGVLKNATDANGEPLPGQEAVFDNGLKALAELNGIPTETSQYGYGVGRLSKRMSEFQNAQAVGAASYGGVTSDQFGARISELQSQIQQKAIKSAPTFNDNSQKNAWLSNPETAGLPFFMGIGGKKALVRATEDPNVMEQFVEKGKSGSPEMVRVDLAASPKTETEKPKSEFTGAGESGQRVRRAVGKVTRGLGEATQSIGNTISDLPYQAVNAASGAAEFGAGVAGYNLNIPKIDTMTEALNKLGLDNRNDFARGKMNLPTVEQIRKDQEMIAKRKKK